MEGVASHAGQRARRALASLVAGALAGLGAAAGAELVVTTTADGGDGSLREALLAAAALPGADRIAFDAGVFASPATISLAAELPSLTGELTIDGYIEDRLWQASGVTLSGGGRLPVLRVAPGAVVRLLHLTIADGAAPLGGGILNRGTLVLHGVTLRDNRADRDGGGLASLAGELTVINSTFAANAAGGRGGGLAVLGGAAALTHCTFSGNRAGRGGGLYAGGRLSLRNSIVADSDAGRDCVAEHGVAVAGSHNLIEDALGCGAPLSTADPRLEPLGYYNGPTPTHPLGASSPAINAGDGTASVDERGDPLRWDQRGPGDPRRVAGFADVGAFEHQRLPVLTVDTVADTGRRGCTPAGPEDCPLRGAIELANVAPEADVVRFDPTVFAEPRALRLRRPLPTILHDLTIDATGATAVAVVGVGDCPPWQVAAGVELRLLGVRRAVARP